MIVEFAEEYLRNLYIKGESNDKNIVISLMWLSVISVPWTILNGYLARRIYLG